MLSCRDISEKGSQLVDMPPKSWRERLDLHLHLFVCDHCRDFIRQFKVLRKTLTRVGRIHKHDQKTIPVDVNSILAKVESARAKNQKPKPGS